MKKHAQATLFRRARMVSKSPLVTSLLQRVAHEPLSFGAFEMANIWWAIEKLEHRLEPPMLAALEARSVETVASMTPQVVKIV